RARLLSPAADPRPAAALDAVGADHRPGHLPVEHAIRCGDGGVPGAHLAGAGGPDADGRPQGERDMMATILRRLYLALVGLFLAAPLLVVLGVSVNEKQDLSFPPKGFSLSWYGQIFLDPG